MHAAKRCYMQRAQKAEQPRTRLASRPATHAELVFVGVLLGVVVDESPFADIHFLRARFACFRLARRGRGPRLPFRGLV